MKQAIDYNKSINHVFRHAIEQVGEGVLIVESSSRHPLGPQILFVSGRVSELTGYPKEALLDQPIGLIYEPEQLNGLVSRLPAVGKTGRIYVMERDALTWQGGRVRCRWTISGVRNEQGQIENFILTLSSLEKPETAAATPPVAASSVSTTPTADSIASREGKKSDRDESGLIESINRGLPGNFWENFHRLKERGETADLDRTESEELTRMADQIEEADAERIEAAAELARLRGVPFDQVLAEFEIETGAVS